VNQKTILQGSHKSWTNQRVRDRIAELIDIVLKIIQWESIMARSVGFIGGGQMAEAIIKGLLSSQTCEADQISAVEPIQERRDYLSSTYGIKTWSDSGGLGTEIQCLLLAVKPQVMETVLIDLKEHYAGQLIITIAAGLPIRFYEEILGAHSPIIRVMPNMGALILESASALCCNAQISAEEMSFATTLLGAVGSTVRVDEKLMDAVTGLSGSGPAFVFNFIDALIEAGVKTGLSRPVARELAVQTVYGAALCLKESDNHPAVLRDQVTSPGGTTASGLFQLEAAGFKATVMEAVEAATQRSAELGRNR
jgi:pyrroline-5-carboxylate reductase